MRWRTISILRPGLAMAACLLTGAGIVNAADRPLLSLADVRALVLRQSPEIRKAATEVARARANLAVESGVFDTVITSGLSAGRYTLYGQGLSSAGTGRWSALGHGVPASLGYFRTSVLSYGTELSRRTRWGLEILGGLDVSHSTFDIGNPDAYLHFLEGRLSMSVPLARSWNPAVSAGDEEASRIEVAVAGAEADAVREARLREAAIAYWRWVAAVEKAAVFRAALDNDRELLAAMDELVATGRRTETDRTHLRVQVLHATLSVERAEAEAERLLSLVWSTAGSRGDPEAAAGRVPADSLPCPASDDAGRNPDPAFLFREALASRPEVRALDAAMAAARLRASAAADRQRPDVTLGIGGDASQELRSGAGDPVYSGVVTLSWRWPVANHDAEGQAAFRAATAARLQAERDRLEIDLGARIERLVASLRATIGEASRLDTAAELHRAAVEDERERLRKGAGTALEVIQAESARLASLTRAVDARLEIALLMTELAYEVGRPGLPDARDCRVWFSEWGSP